MNNKKRILILFLTAIICFISNSYMVKKYVGNILSNNLYKEIRISGDELLKNTDQLEINGTRIKSTGDDPKIYIDFDNPINICEITFNIENMDSQNLWGGIFWNNESGHKDMFLKDGENVIDINTHLKKVSNLRIDPYSLEKISADMNGIIINDRTYIADIIFEKVYNFLNPIILLVYFMLASVLFFNVGKQKKSLNFKGFVVYAAVLALYFTFYKFNIQVLRIVLYPFLMYMTGCILFDKIHWVYLRINKKINRIDFMAAIFILSFLFLILGLYSIALLMLFYISYEKGRINEDCGSKNIKWFLFFTILVFAMIFILHIHALSYDNYLNKSKMIYLLFFEYIFILLENLYGISNGICNKLGRKTKIVAFSFITVSIFSVLNNDFAVSNYLYIILILILYFVLKFNLDEKIFIYNTFIEGDDSYLNEKTIIFEIIKLIFFSACILIIYNLTYIYYISGIIQFKNIIVSILTFIKTPAFCLNLFAVSLFIYTIKTLFGKYLASFVSLVIFSILLIGNLIKMKYQKAFLKPVDFSYIGDLIRISKSFIKPIYLILIICAITIFILICIKKIGISKFKPKISILCFVISLTVLTGIYFDKFYDVKEFTWRDDIYRYNDEGIFFYNTENIMSYIKQLKKTSVSGYSETEIHRIKDEFNKIGNLSFNTSEEKPTVLLIMLESYFDIEKIEDINFSTKIMPDEIRNCIIGNSISPAFGGGTANVEMEALTGLSNYFLEGTLYNQYNSDKQKLNSIVKEFNKSAYKTTAIHPNTSSFYNRKRVYKVMDFDEFYSIDDFPSDAEKNNSGFILNSELEKFIESKVESSENPQFIFTVSIEGHSPYVYNDDDVNINIESDKYSDSALKEAQTYAQTAYNTGQFLLNLKNYIENSDKPIIVYAWGDHLPALSIFNESDFTNDLYNKYATPIIAFSNYKSMDKLENEYITPNQLSVQMLYEAGIEHDSYFDYIYSLRKDFPVITKEFFNYDDYEKIRDYNLLEYDLTYGKKYILEE